MEKLSPWKTGSALAVTGAIAYAVCALLFLAFPGLATSFLESLFHGLQFRRLQSAGEPFSFAGFGLVAVALFVYAFAVGWLFAAIRNMLVR